MSKKRQLQVFDVALSFAGEDRAFAELLAKELLAYRVDVFYDKFFQSDLWGKDLYEHIEDIYKNRAKFCILLVSQHYARKKWTRHERRSAQARAFAQGPEYILPVRLDGTELPGLPETVGYIDAREVPIPSLVSLILEKLDFKTEESQRRRLEALCTRIERSTGRVHCMYCHEPHHLDSAYVCVECERAYCWSCVHQQKRLPDGHWLCGCGGTLY